MRTLLWLAFLTTAACADAVGPDVDQLEVTVTTSRDEMVVGDLVEFHVVARNPTAQALRFATNTCILVVRVLDGRGFPVFESPGTCNDIALSHGLEPGASLEMTVLFDGTTSWGPFLDDSGGDAHYVLDAGVYQVVAGVSSDLLNPSPAVELRIRSSR